MLREYEFTLISSAQLSDSDVEAHLKKYEEIMTNDGGEVIKKDVWGTRKLSYPINKHFRGHYTVYDLSGSPANMAEAERLMKIDDNVLRYLSIKLGDDVNVDKRKEEIEAARVAAEKKSSEKSE